jgi:hypothetical protein
MMIAGVACAVNGLVTLVLRARGHEIRFTFEGLWLAALAGAAATGVDLFALLGYERGLRLTSSLLIEARRPGSSCSLDSSSCGSRSR